MTTTVILKTHSWPVDVTTTDRYGRSMTTTVETVEPNSERQFYLSDTRQVMFTELPMPIADAADDIE